MDLQYHPLVKLELSVSQILLVYGKQFKQIKMRLSDELNSTCAMGFILS